MKTVIQRVTQGKVIIDGQIKAQIGQGLMILLGIVDEDEQADIDWLTQKIANLRIFDDDNGIMNVSVKDIDGDIIVVSQFTLHASTKKGNRPSYIKAAKPDIAVPLYQAFVAALEQRLGKTVQTGEFGAMMQLDFINDGPVTIIIDSKQKT
ncbi:MAG: D-tyrosyl-tRNA(Tyr) deacylase [Flavobacteriales bacterium]|nr:MAG: D-tyrosyl-tRNA(Tyr) deacylase [Flavobacteriales bacterium]